MSTQWLRFVWLMSGESDDTATSECLVSPWWFNCRVYVWTRNNWRFNCDNLLSLLIRLLLWFSLDMFNTPLQYFWLYKPISLKYPSIYFTENSFHCVFKTFPSMVWRSISGPDQEDLQMWEDSTGQRLVLEFEAIRTGHFSGTTEQHHAPRAVVHKERM